MREDRRYDWQDSQRPPRGYETGGYDRGDGGGGYRDAGAPRAEPPKASVGRRVLSKALFAIVILALAVGGYAFTRGHSLGSLIALFTTPEPAAEAPTLATTPSPIRSTAAPTQSVAARSTVPPGQAGVPNVPTMVLLIRNVIVALDQANGSGNYAVLRALAAPGFQQATTTESLTKAFADLRGRNVDLGQVSVVNPRLVTQPAITKEGLLRLTGVFPVNGHDVNFDMLFQLVANRWMLFGLAVQPADGMPSGKVPDRVGDSEATAASMPPKMPDSPALVQLVRGSVLALSQANITGDYSVLHDISSPGFQRSNDTARLAQLFAALRARNLDLGPVAVIEPRLFKPASIDDHGYLRLTGYFPSRPEQVNFDLAFEFAAGQWRLFGIGLNTTAEVPTATNAPAPGAAPVGQPEQQAAATPAPMPQEHAANPSSAAPSGLPTVEPPLPRLRPTE